MVKNKVKLNKFYQKLIRQEKISYKKSLALYEALHKEALSLKAISSGNILDGLETDLRVAKIINAFK